MTMKKLIYFLALGAALLIGASCDKESDNVPLYVNTWVTDSNSLLTFGGKSVDYGFYQINADKTFSLSFLANENVLEVLKTKWLPRLEPSERVMTITLTKRLKVTRRNWPKGSNL